MQLSAQEEELEMRRYLKWLAAAGAVILLPTIVTMLITACSSSSSGSQSGTLGISLTDASIAGFDQVNVTVIKVRVHQSSAASENDSGWYDMTLNPARKINLLDLANGVLEELGQTALPAGHYTQLRLVLSANTGGALDNSAVLAGTTAEIPLVTPSALRSGIKLIHEFDVAAGQHVDLVLDFDALRSIVPRGSGSYALKPVISVIPTELNGIGGFINATQAGSNTMVSAQVDGAIVRSVAPNSLTGEFFLGRLTPGAYNVVLTADGHATAIIAGVPVSSTTSTVQVSTRETPISLPTSSTRTISGTAALNPVDATGAVVVTAKQTAGAATVAIKMQNVDQISGAYALSLPVAAPVLGQYGTGALPVELAAQTAAAGAYSVEASADGYLTQSVSKDISGADATQDFILVP
jgi:uncharacterized protein DUF4382